MSNILPNYLTISKDLNRDIETAISESSPDKIGLLVDENTSQHCRPFLDLKADLIIQIKSGESEKNLITCNHIWSELTGHGFTRNSLLINLGGGVIGDMGGFAAATFKRGMKFINVPTTLLSQVDASIGGKLGVDFNGLKNHIGLFQEPTKVIVYPKFLDTLSERELKSGFAEIIKHALIADKDQWDFLQNHPFNTINWADMIPKSIEIKNKVVAEDPQEKGLRKILNYGHTIGHAIETHFLNTENHLLHGEAVAVGMILENEIALKMGMITPEINERIGNYIQTIYTLPSKLPGYQELKKHLSQDKKNDAQGIRFSLLSKEGVCTINVLVEEEVLKEILR